MTVIVMTRPRGWTLPELLVVFGIIAVLAGLVLSTVAAAQRHAQTVQCQSNLRVIGQTLHAYAADNDGWLCPIPATFFGTDVPPHERWPARLFKIASADGPLPYNPASYTRDPYDPEMFPAGPFTPDVMRCPTDEDPKEAHSYMLNGHLGERGFRLGSRDLGGRTSAGVILAGEKRSDMRDYYMEKKDFERTVEPFRHGKTRGSNYLFIDGHVELQLPREVMGGIDPWDVVAKR